MKPWARAAVPDRERFRKIIGVVDQRVRFDAPSLTLLLKPRNYTVYAARWPGFQRPSSRPLAVSPHSVYLSSQTRLPQHLQWQYLADGSMRAFIQRPRILHLSQEIGTQPDLPSWPPSMTLTNA